MAVKFIRTCDRCGKVIEERNGYDVAGKEPAKSNAKYGVLSAESHPIFSLKSIHLCPDCCEDFENFMQGHLVCDISDRDALSEENNASPALYKNIDQFGRGEITKEGLEHLKPSDEALALMREHNAKYDAEETEFNKDGPIYKYISSFANKAPDTKTYHKWTKDEDAFLIEERDRKVKTPKMAEKLGLSLSQVRSRIKYLDALRKEKEHVKNESDGWSDEVLEMARKHNEQITAASIDSEPIAQEPIKDKTKIKLAPGTHTYHHWTAEEDRAIIKSSGKTLNDLACQFGTTIAAVRARKILILNGKVDINRED